MGCPPHHMGRSGEGEKVQNGLKQKLWPKRIIRGPCACRRQHNLRVLGQKAPKMTQNDQNPLKNHQKPFFSRVFRVHPAVYRHLEQSYRGLGGSWYPGSNCAALFLNFGALAACRDPQPKMSERNEKWRPSTPAVHKGYA